MISGAIAESLDAAGYRTPTCSVRMSKHMLDTRSAHAGQKAEAKDLAQTLPRVTFPDVAAKKTSA